MPESKCALVTGASGGIGLDLAECFARDDVGRVRGEVAIGSPVPAVAVSTIGASLPDFRIITIALLYSLGAHGIMTLNDFKSINGDRSLGVRGRTYCCPVTFRSRRSRRQNDYTRRRGSAGFR